MFCIRLPVTSSETVGLRTRPVWDQKKSVLVLHTLVLVLQVWCCVVKHGLVTLVVIMILKDTATFQVLFIVSLVCAWNITTVEINSGIYITYKLNPPSAFIYRYFRWSWSCYPRRARSALGVDTVFDFGCCVCMYVCMFVCMLAL